MIHKVALGAPMAALILILSLKRAIGFHPAVAPPPTRTVDTRLAMTKKTKKVKKSIVPSVDRNPFREVEIDVNKAKDAADHFGRYSVKEIERMRDDLHAHRVQSMVFGNEIAPPEEFQERFLEDELSLQLHLLQSETPDPYLFPEVTTSANQELKKRLPHLQDGTSAAKLEHEKEVFFLEELMEEGVLESLAICSIIAFLMAAPQIFQ